MIPQTFDSWKSCIINDLNQLLSQFRADKIDHENSFFHDVHMCCESLSDQSVCLLVLPDGADGAGWWGLLLDAGCV